ncbi:bifunctional diguanylate cyclase/phosphodiesterase [Halopseudomonas laoshanensis]|uniref:bifunctional diguanylate cyclase/phosphodiesterase n=1 Tax=Halopseudomonas laoshanensis TaxID=2268758 RepID=UPI0011EE8137|nr:EAL domain-containing protein [Halopseudomonas laoshanensis]
MIKNKIVIALIAALASLLVLQWALGAISPSFDLSATATQWLLALVLVITGSLLCHFYCSQKLIRQLRRDARAALERNIQVMAAVRDVVFRAEFDGSLVYVNRAWQDLTGMDAASVRGHSILEGFHESDRGLLKDYLHQVRGGHTEPLQADLRLRDLAGRYRWSRLTARPYLTTESGAVIIGTLQDIQAQQEQAMIQSARLNVLDGLLGKAGVREMASQLAKAWENVQMGQRVSVLLLDPDTGALQTLAAPSMPEQYNQALNGTMPAEGVGSCGTAIHRGEPVYVSDVRNDPLWQDFQDLAELGSVVSCWSTPFSDQDGQILGSFAVYADQARWPDDHDLQLMSEFTRLTALIVQKSRLAQEREFTEKRFSAIFEHAAVGILLVSPTGRYISANPCYLEGSGYSEETLQRMTPRDLLVADDIPLVERGLRDLRFGLVDEFVLEARYYKYDKSVVWINLTITLVRDPEGVALYYVFITEDISERKEQEQSLKEAAALFESSGEGMMVMDSKFHILRVNPAFTHITGLNVEDILGQRPSAHRDDMDSRTLTHHVVSALVQDGRWQGEVLLDRPGERDVPIWVTATAVRDGGNQISRYMAMFSDLSGLQRSQQQLQHMAHFDSLTGLANRTLALLKLDQGMQRAAAQKIPLAVLYIDLDRFKAINDSLGHAIGDEVLRQAGRRLARCCDDADTLARLSGDEFLLISHGRQPESVRELGEHICTSMRAPVVLEDGREIYIGASVGYACYPLDGDSSADLVRNADAAMDTAKSIGRDQVCGYSRAMTEEASQRFELERGLRKALENHEFELHYQPLIQVRSRRAYGVEALLRWRHPQHGLIAPDKFIPLAEQNGLIVQIGSWVLHEACRQARQWQEQGLGLEMIAVNLSPRQFIQQDVVALVRTVLEESGLPASMLELEITESALMANAQQGEQTLRQLKDLGVTLAIDDFGTGYSSLAYLRRFPLDKLKIDKSFLAGVPQNTEDNQLVTTILDMAANMRLHVVAEGVETEAQWRFLQGRGCGACQGFLFSRALPPAGLPDWLAQQ